MKFVRYNEGRTGILAGPAESHGVVDVTANAHLLGATRASELLRLLPNDGAGSWTPMIQNWEAVRGWLEDLLALTNSGNGGVAVQPLHSVRLMAPLPDPARSIFALGSNFMAHAVLGWKMLGKDVSDMSKISEKSQGLPPWGFLVLSDTVVGPAEDIGVPSDIKYFDYEAEVAIVLGRGGKDMKADEIKIWGYTAWNDLSIRDPRVGLGPAMNRGGFTWGLEKNFDRGNVCGPFMVVDEFDANNLRCRLRVNGESRQDFSTADMLWTFGDAAEHISHYVTLKPGDVILSGTGSGVAIESGVDCNLWLKPGDLVEVEVEGAGIQRNRVV